MMSEGPLPTAAAPPPDDSVSVPNRAFAFHVQLVSTPGQPIYSVFLEDLMESSQGGDPIQPEPKVPTLRALTHKVLEVAKGVTQTTVDDADVILTYATTGHPKMQVTVDSDRELHFAMGILKLCPHTAKAEADPYPSLLLQALIARKGQPFVEAAVPKQHHLLDNRMTPRKMDPSTASARDAITGDISSVLTSISLFSFRVQLLSTPGRPVSTIYVDEVIKTQPTPPGGGEMKQEASQAPTFHALAQQVLELAVDSTNLATTDDYDVLLTYKPEQSKGWRMTIDSDRELHYAMVCQQQTDDVAPCLCIQALVAAKGQTPIEAVAQEEEQDTALRPPCPSMEAVTTANASIASATTNAKMATCKSSTVKDNMSRKVAAHKKRAPSVKHSSRGGTLAQRILGTLLELRSLGITVPSRQQVALLAGCTLGKGFANAASVLAKQHGHVTYPDHKTIQLTVAGQKAAASRSSAPTMTTTDDVHERFRGLLPSKKARALFDVLADGRSHTRDAAAAQLGYTDGKQKGFQNTMSQVKSLGLMEYASGGSGTQLLRLTDLAFPFGRPTNTD